jgi:hypothetical protein
MIVPDIDRYTLCERLIGGVGSPRTDRVIGRFGNPDVAYARLLATLGTYPEMYGGDAPTHQLVVKDARA